MTDLLGLIDSLARVQLAAKRAGGTVCGVYGAPAGLTDLVAFCGLADVLVVKPCREPVEREERFGVEEERALDDPSA